MSDDSERRVNASDRRASRRYEGHFRVRFRDMPAFETEFRTNISYGGLFVHTKQDLTVDSIVRIELMPSGVDVKFDLTGRVVRCSEDPKGVAIQFTDLTPDVLSHMEKLFLTGVTPIEDRRGQDALPQIDQIFPTLGELAEALMLNFSSDGGVVHTDKVMPMGSECSLQLGTSASSGPIVTLSALVLDTITDDAGEPVGMRLKFLSAHEKDRQQIRAFAAALRDAINL